MPIANCRFMGSAWLLLLTSCAAPAPTPMDYTVRHVRQGERGAAMDAAEAGLMEGNAPTIGAHPSWAQGAL